MEKLNSLEQLDDYDNLEKYKEDIIYGVDTLEKLQYARGRINALEMLLQDLNDLQKKEENL